MARTVHRAAPSRYEEAEESIGFLLWQVSTTWRRTIEAALAAVNLTHPQFVVITAIWYLTRSGRLTTQSEAGRFVHLDPNTMSAIIRGLEARSLISRVRSADDRAKNPSLTAKGSRLVQRALPAVEDADADFFSSLVKADRDAFGGTLRALKRRDNGT